MTEWGDAMRKERETKPAGTAWGDTMRAERDTPSPSPSPSPSPEPKSTAYESFADFGDAAGDALTFGLSDRVLDTASAGDEARQMRAKSFGGKSADPAMRRMHDGWEMEAKERALQRYKALSSKNNAERSERSPLASGAGTAAGIVLPMLVSGGLGGGAAAARGGAAGGETAMGALRTGWREAVKRQTAMAAKETPEAFTAQGTRIPGFGPAGMADEATRLERIAQRSGALARKASTGTAILADVALTGGAVTSAKAALVAASKAPAGAAALKAALKNLASRGGPRASMASVVASGTIGVDRALDDEDFAKELQFEFEAVR